MFAAISQKPKPKPSRPFTKRREIEPTRRGVPKGCGVLAAADGLPHTLSHSKPLFAVPGSIPSLCNEPHFALLRSQPIQPRRSRRQPEADSPQSRFQSARQHPLRPTLHLDQLSRGLVPHAIANHKGIMLKVRPIERYDRVPTKGLQVSIPVWSSFAWVSWGREQSVKRKVVNKSRGPHHRLQQLDRLRRALRRDGLMLRQSAQHVGHFDVNEVRRDDLRGACDRCRN
jgi:hypothetical protein